MVPTVRLGTNLRHTLDALVDATRWRDAIRDTRARCDGAFLLLVKATDLDFLQVRFFVGRGMCERRAPSTFFSRNAGDALEASPNESLVFSPSLNDLPDLLTMSE